MAEPPALDQWIARKTCAALNALAAAISAEDLTRHRPLFGQTVRPARGSVLASVHPGAWDPEPDYFHCWARDAAVVMRRVSTLATAGGQDAPAWRRRWDDWLRFTLAATNPARPPPPANPLRERTRQEGLRFLRPEAELAGLSGPALLGEPRCGADGAPDCERWTGAQYDGPALRAVACMAAVEADPAFETRDLAAMLARDLAFTRTRAGAPCVGPWEEGPPRVWLFTLITQWDALDRGAAWERARGGEAAAQAMAGAAAALAARAEPAWDAAQGCWRACLGAGADDMDAAVLVALAETGRSAGPFAMTGTRADATLAALDRRFAALYPVNEGLSAPLLGRWPADRFFGGNPWLPTTCAAAVLDYAAGRTGRGDARLAALAARIGPEAFPEQLDRADGAPVSCPALTWSAAAFLSAAEARAAAYAAAR